MAKSNFLTDRFSTIGGLAAVAYGSSVLFPTVANQIKQTSRTKALDAQIPSHALLDFVGTKNFILDIVKSVLDSKYGKEEALTDFIDIYAKSTLAFSTLFVDVFVSNINTYSTYSVSPSQIIQDSLGKTSKRFDESGQFELDLQNITSEIIQKFIDFGYIGEDILSVIALLINNPNTKVTAAPPDSIVELDVQGVSTKDHRGVDRAYGTLSPGEYYSGVAYKPFGNSIKQSVVEGYVGYPLVSLLGESLLNPDSYDNLDLNFANSSVLGEIANDSNLSEEAQSIYNINLATINLG